MTINIALSTIIYIMVFLFPGILFRRSFFSGKFNNHFESGNPLERFLWNILTSVFLLIVFTLSLNILSEWSNNKIGFDVKSSDIVEIFICLYENKFPAYFNNYNDIANILKLLGSIYLMSIVIGIIINQIILVFRLDKTFKFLDFNRNWENLLSSNKLNNSDHKHGDISMTDIDIKTKENELFTGRLHDLIYNKDGNIYTITLINTYKFYKIDKNIEGYENLIREVKIRIKKNPEFTKYHFESKDAYIYKKRIKGNIFAIFADKIENISITYVKIGNVYNKILNFIQKFTLVNIIILCLFIFTNAFWDFHLLNFLNTNKRIAFSLVTPLLILSIYNIIKSLLAKKIYKTEYKKLKNDLWLIFLLFIPNLYIYSIFSFLITLSIFIFAITLTPKTDNKADNQTDKNTDNNKFS